ncbi:MAG: hypothetical protein PHV05_11365, partial [Candidatus Riflebacteria bacterium]|nr:hypothetical protein [Candidatus Riflebacteria bacterium]
MIDLKNGNHSSKQNYQAILITAFLVLLIPIVFFNTLLKTSLARNRETEMNMLRETVLQTADKIKAQMKPTAYVEEIVRNVHREVLPEVTPELLKMHPAVDFGKKEFSDRLPEKLLKSL